MSHRHHDRPTGFGARVLLAGLAAFAAVAFAAAPASAQPAHDVAAQVDTAHTCIRHPHDGHDC